MEKEYQEKFEAEFQRLKKLYPNEKIEYACGEFFIRGENGSKTYFYYPNSIKSYPSKDYKATPQNFFPAKNWLDVMKHIGAFDEKEYNKRLEKLKVDHNINSISKEELARLNFENEKKWLGIKLDFKEITQEQYDKKLKELKEKFYIKD